MKIYNPQTVYWSVPPLIIGVFLCAQGEVGWLFGLPFVVVGLGLLAAGFTNCGEPTK